ncbi:hypothetical protein [Chryseolinea soli]|nr:hypothetical protein [Chryseolinea soli]
MKFEIIPYKAFGKILLGMSKEEVRSLIRSPVTEFYRNEFSITPTDSFEELGLFVSYDEQLKCEAFEIRTPSEPIFQGVNLLAGTYESLRNWISEMDKEIVEDNTGLTSFKFGFGLYAPDKNEDPLQNCEGVIVFREGYYDVLYQANALARETGNAQRPWITDKEYGVIGIIVLVVTAIALVVLVFLGWREDELIKEMKTRPIVYTYLEYGDGKVTSSYASNDLECLKQMKAECDSFKVGVPKIALNCTERRIGIDEPVHLLESEDDSEYGNEYAHIALFYVSQKRFPRYYVGYVVKSTIHEKPFQPQVKSNN